MNRFCTLAVLLLTVAAPASAQGPDTFPLPGSGARAVLTDTVSVTGHAEMKAAPDVAYISLSVTTDGRTSAEAAASNTRQTTMLLDALHKAKVNARDIQTQGYSVQPQYDYKPSPPVLTGFQATNSVQVTVRDLGRVGPLLDAATAAGATSAGDVSFDLLDKEVVQNGVLAKAVINAHAHANVMAEAAGVSVGRPLSIAEGTAPVVQPLLMARSTMMAKGTDAAPTPISAQQITVSADVSVVYALLPK